jgi:hypothetical protein
MQKEKDIVQEAFINMKNVEEAIAKNAKGILASTMKEEINQLVKESLSEQDDEEISIDAETEPEDEDLGDVEVDKLDMDLNPNEEEPMGSEDMDFGDMDLDTNDESPIDLTDASDEEILRVFKAMGEEDGIIIKKDGEDIHLKDNDADVEYLVKLGESKNKKINENMNIEEMDDVETQKVIEAIFANDENLGSEFEEDEVMYEIEFDEDEDMMESDDDEMMESDDDEMMESDDDEMMESDDDEMMESDDDEMMESDDDEMMESDDDEMMESDDDEMMESDDDEMMESDNLEESDWEESLEEAYSHKKVKKETKESKKSIKPKGVGIGSGPKFKYKDKSSGGFKEDKKEGPKTMGTGKAKFDYKKGANMDGKSKVVKRGETKEAARTLGMGSKFRKGGLPKPRAHSKVNNALKEGLQSEVNMLREKNEEYRKALNIFREKLNEVAVFNSNLAYATRLFTEHSTTKKEKINILRRFDDVESLKESKSLYRSIKEELSKSESKTINESVEKKINNVVSSGSAPSLIESKTYENPQFLRIKDLMDKLK